MDNGEARALIESFDKLGQKIEAVLEAQTRAPAPAPVNNSGTWVCLTCCVAMFVMFTVTLRDSIRQDRINGELYEATAQHSSYLSSIFGRVPDLKKAVEADYELKVKMKGSASEAGSR